ncbi:DUF6153 family protein [Arthrobacter sp. HLT1-20]
MPSIRLRATVGPLLRWSLLLGVTLGVVAGLLGMHVVLSVSTSSAHHGMAASASASHAAHEGELLPEAIATHSSVHGPEASPDNCNCPPTGHGAAVAHHGDCSPTLGQQAPSVPLPGTLNKFAAGSLFPATLGHEALDRTPPAPSLAQLSISRT